MADAAWEEMQRESRVGSADVTRLLRKSMASTAKKTTTTTKRTAKRDLEKQIASSRPLASKEAATRHPSVSIDGASGQEPFSLARELNRLADERQSVRKQAAVALEAHFLSDAIRADPQAEDTTSPLLPEGTSLSDMAKPLFKRFNDPVEKVRDVCVRLTATLLPHEPDLLRVLPYLLPAISNRLDSQWGYDEENQVFTRDQFLHDAFKRGRVLVSETDVTRIQPNEPSEEIRLQFLELVATLLDVAFSRKAASLLHAYVFDILLMLVSALHDDFHELNIRACAVLATLCDHMVSVMKHFTVGFVRAAKHLLAHRLARVRVAAVQCVQALVACPNFEKCKGSGTEAIVDLLGHRDENVIPIAAFYTGEVRVNYFAKLDQDANATVRAAFYTLVQDWILNLPDRYDHESRLMPYVLSAVSDELPEISHRAMRTLEELGKRYEQEHGEEVLEMKQYGVDGKNPSYNYTKQFPAPFESGRPSLGTRLYVRGRTRRFLNPILRELANWQSPTRAHAVRLLKCVLVYGEETITVDAHVLLQTLLKTWDHEGRESTCQFEEIADLVGRFVEPKTYLPLLLGRIRGEEEIVGSVVAPEQLAAVLEVLHFVLGGSLDKTLLPHVHEIVDAVASENVVAFETPRIKRAQATLAHQLMALLQRRGRDAVSAFFLEHGRLTSLERVFEQLFEMAVALRAETAHPDIEELATSTLTMLSDVESRTSMSALYDAHFDACVVRAAGRVASRSVVQWKQRAFEQLVLDQLLRHASPEWLNQSAQRAALVSAHVIAMLDCSSGNEVAKPRTARGRHYEQLRVLLQERLAGSDEGDAQAGAAWQTLFAINTAAPVRGGPTDAAGNATAA